ncbi:MAG TPA: tetratricopeptide repeat protein [Pyrinomonadaceae bacterium]|nr:tetratricopeptide repeat protein [Pyrinomonadaceae bacterium]
MDRQKLLYALAGLALGAIASFLFANAANRRELDELRSELARVRTQSQAGAQTVGQGAPQDGAQVRELIARADANPADMNVQRQAGEEAYRHALTTGQSAVLADAVRLLKRAHEADPGNYDLLLLIGNSYLTLGLARDPQNFNEARGYYVKALEARPGDVNAHTLLGMTYFYGRPPDPESAAREYRKALAADPRHEMALQNLASSLITTGAFAEAARRIEELQQVNPSNQSIPKLREELAAARGGNGARGRE